MNRIGINLWNYIKTYTDGDLPLLGEAASLGYTAVEIPMNSCDFSPAPLRDTALSLGLELTQCAALTAGRDLSHEDRQVRENTVAYLKQCIDLGAAMGSKLICGPLYAGGGKMHLPDREGKARELELAAENISRVAAYARDNDIRLAVEPVNRYRTSVVNNVSQAIELVKMIDMLNVGVLYDTYQANIEETDMDASLEAVLQEDMLFHFHAADSNRGVPGCGHVPFVSLFKLLTRYGYGGHVTIETFMPGSLDPVWIETGLSRRETASAGIKNISEMFTAAAAL